MKLWSARSQTCPVLAAVKHATPQSKNAQRFYQVVCKIPPKDLPNGTEGWKEQRVVQYRSVTDADRDLWAETRTFPHF